MTALVVAAAGVTYAAIPSSDGTITGCVNAMGGQLRVIDAAAGQTCNSGSETVLTWKDGINGKVADADKLDGKDSGEYFSGLTRVINSGPTNSDSPKSVSAICPAGKRVVGTGGYVFPGWVGKAPKQQTRVVVTSIYPSGPEAVPGSVRVTGYEQQHIDSSWRVVAMALCANASP